MRPCVDADSAVDPTRDLGGAGAADATAQEAGTTTSDAAVTVVPHTPTRLSSRGSHDMTRSDPARTSRHAMKLAEPGG